MKRTIFCKVTVDDETAFKQINDGPVPFLEKKIKELERNNIILEDAFLSDEDECDLWQLYINYIANWAIEHQGDDAKDGVSPMPWDCFYDIHSTIRRQAKLLPGGWIWVHYNDQSGYLESPDQKEYFSYDWSTGEYKITPDAPWEFYMIESPASSVGYSIGGFKDFQEEAENWIRDNIL